MFKTTYKFFHEHYHNRYHGKYMHAKKLFIFDLFLLGLSLLALGSSLFFFFWKPGLTDWIDLAVSYDGGRIKSGEKISLTIDYTNRSKFTLKKATLAVNLPPGFIIDRSQTPSTDFSDNSTFDLPDLKPGAKGQKVIRGRIWSEPKKEERIISILSYTPENSSRPEQKLSSFLMNLPESVLALQMKFDTKSSFPSATFPITLTLSNNGPEALEKINLSTAWPSNITWEEKLSDITLPPNGSKKINGTISMPAQAGMYQLKIEPQISANSHSIKQGLISQEVSVFFPEIKSYAALETDKNYAEPGMNLPVKISWNNNSPYELKNLRIKLVPTPGVVDLKATASENNIRLINGEIVLDSTKKTLLSSVKPNSSGDIRINLTLASTFNVGEKEKAYLEIKPVVEAGLSEVEGQKFTSDGDAARILLATEARLFAEARYFTDEGDQLGRGPLPPRAGETTKYWVFMRLTNTTNPLRDAKFSAKLTPGASLTGKQSVTLGEPIKASGDSLSWNYYQIPANSVTGLYFEVALTPTPEQVGKNLELVRSIQFTAADDITGKQFNLSKSQITNILPSNDRGAGMGAKVE